MDGECGSTAYRSKMRSRDGQAGFTLVEVLAALIVTAAFVAVVLPFAGRLATRWWVGEATVEAADAWMQALARLGDDLSQAVPLTVSQGEKDIVSFDAGPDFVRFVRPALGGASNMRLEIVRYDIRPSAAGTALIRRARPSGDGPSADAGPPTTILEGSFRLRFRVYGHDNVPQLTWAGADDMPAGVELTIVGKDRNATPPSPVLLPVSASAPGRTP